MSASYRASHIPINIFSEASELLIRSHDKILNLWEVAVRAELPKAKHQSSLALLDSLPFFLLDLASLIATTDFYSPGRVPFHFIGGHGKHRAEIGGYTLQEVMREYTLLRKTIFNFFEEKKLLVPYIRDVILDSIDTCMNNAAQEFVAVHADREKQTIERAKEAENYYLDLINHLEHVIIWEMDPSDKQFKFIGNRVHALFGGSTELPKENYAYDSLIKHVYPDDRQLVLNALYSASVTETAQQLEHRMVVANNKVLWFHTNIYIKKGEEEKENKIWGICVEITSLKRIEEEHSHILALSHLDLARLREEREIRERFVATLTHDLRTPLTTMKMSAQIIQTLPEAAGVNPKFINYVLSSIDRIDQMINDLLDANSIRAGQKLPLKMVACEMKSIAAEAVDSLSLIHKNRFVLRAESSVDGFWCAKSIRRIIDNLAGNAIKYGDKELPITIGITEANENVFLSVHNFGRILTSHEQETLFQPFHRTLSAQEGFQKGWGLGLTLVRGIAEAHGGKAVVRSIAGEGTTFTVILPRDARPFQPGFERIGQ